jgi:hypothetical protein
MLLGEAAEVPKALNYPLDAAGGDRGDLRIN